MLVIVRVRAVGEGARVGLRFGFDSSSNRVIEVRSRIRGNAY